jgi:hypothetical protein
MTFSGSKLEQSFAVRLAQTYRRNIRQQAMQSLMPRDELHSSDSVSSGDALKCFRCIACIAASVAPYKKEPPYTIPLNSCDHPANAINAP